MNNIYSNEMDGLFKDDFDDDYYEKIERIKNDPKRHAYAKSIIGKYCVCNSEKYSPFLTNLFCKVVRQGDYRYGGNPGQVHIIVYQNNEGFDFKKWWLIPSREWLECIDSSHLTITDKRPTVSQRLKSIIRNIIRIATSSVEVDYHYTKNKGFFKDTNMHHYLTPEMSLLMAISDTVKAFKYGIKRNYTVW